MGDNDELLAMLIPAPWVVQEHLRRVEAQRGSLRRLLRLSRDEERRRAEQARPANANTEEGA